MKGYSITYNCLLGQWNALSKVMRFAKTKKRAYELAHLMADSDEAHRCYVAHFLEYGYARRPQKADDKFIAELAASSKDGTHTIKQIILELTKSDAFLNRAPVEE